LEVSGQLYALAVLPPRKGLPVPIAHESELIPEPVSMMRREEILFPRGTITRNLRLSCPQPVTITTALSWFLIRHIKNLIAHILMGKNMDINVE
jgi:hypothetical protein